MIDVQNQSLTPQFAISSVGVRELAYPFMLSSAEVSEDSNPSATALSLNAQGIWKLHAALSASRRGTHMSRYIGALDSFVQEAVTPSRMHDLAKQLIERQDSENAKTEVRFTFFERVEAPVSRIPSYLNHEVTWAAAAGIEEYKEITLRSAATALCPCSKAISDRGAHNQRSYITARLRFAPESQTIPLHKLTGILTQCASAQVYPLLKREDEKLLTEQAYDRPQFVEDTCREVALRLTDLPGLQQASFSVQNEESIHNHPCFAEIEWSQDHGSLA